MLKDSFQGKRVLVTGHTGFKGTWLTAWLQSLGAIVCGISIDTPTEPSHYVEADMGANLQDFRFDISELESVCEVVENFQPEYLFHLAAQPLVRRSYEDPERTWRVNTIGTLNVLESLRRSSNPCNAIIITSDKCYDNLEWPWGYRETDRLGGADPYSASKGAAELVASSYFRSYFKGTDSKIRICTARAGNVIGGGGLGTRPYRSRLCKSMECWNRS